MPRPPTASSTFDDVHNIMRALKLAPDAPVATLSHGSRYKLRLCATMCCSSGVDLLLLDEPTSHLDLTALLFLERFVRRCPRRLSHCLARRQLPPGHHRRRL
jgi:ATPase subunit of ABC transporter with duplicated ATPase domains